MVQDMTFHDLRICMKSLEALMSKLEHAISEDDFCTFDQNKRWHVAKEFPSCSGFLIAAATAPAIHWMPTICYGCLPKWSISRSRY